MTSTAVVMPAYNEAEGVVEFIEELAASFDEDLLVIVCDDSSTDDTVARLDALVRTGAPVRLMVSETNMGHGPTTLRALREGLASGADVVVAVDGDGQFSGADIARVAAGVRAGSNVVEGARTSRRQPLFRHLATQATRVLVWARSRQMPRDANTPLRAYDAGVLADLLRRIPPGSMTPNLHMSALVRRHGLDFRELEVAWLERRADPASSTTFGVTRTFPSLRFLTFCLRATVQWARLGQ